MDSAPILEDNDVLSVKFIRKLRDTDRPEPPVSCQVDHSRECLACAVPFRTPGLLPPKTAEGCERWQRRSSHAPGPHVAGNDLDPPDKQPESSAAERCCTTAANRPMLSRAAIDSVHSLIEQLPLYEPQCAGGLISLTLKSLHLALVLGDGRQCHIPCNELTFVSMYVIRITNM